MALTISSTGSEISTEKFIFTAVTDDVLVTSVIMHVLINNTATAHKLEHLPILGTTDEFEFEINSIIKDYFASEFIALTGANQTVIQNAIVGVNFFEVINNVPSVVQHKSFVIIKNMTQDTFEIEDFDLNDYDCGDTGSDSRKFLTSSPNPLPIGDKTSVHVSCLTTSYTLGLGFTPNQEWLIQTLLDGVLVSTTTEDVNVATRSITSFVNSGKYDISNYRFDFNTNDGIDEVRILIRDIASPFTTRSETKVFKINDACERSITLSWLNEFGTQDTFTFLGNITRVGKYSDKTFKRVRPVNPLSTNVGDLVYKSDYNHQYDIFSDRMPEASVQWLSKMLINKRAAIQSNSIPTAYTGTVTANQLASPIVGALSTIPYGITVDAGNGFMYVIPFVETDILKINISTGIITSFGSFTASVPKWFSAEVAPNGKIYCIPYYDDDVLVIDPSNDTTSTLAIPTSTGVFEKWSTSAITVSGVIYCFPRGATVSSILKIDTNTDTVTEFGTITGKYFSCGLSSNGFIYAFGRTGDDYLKLNPATDAISTFGTQIDDVNVQRLYEENGIMYGFGASNIIKLDTSNDTITSSTNVSVGLASGWADAILAQDGKFYFPPSSGDSLLRYDPVLNTASALFVIETAPEWDSIGISNSGIMYAIPTITNEVLKLTLGQVSGTGQAGKYFPIVIETDETTLADKFTPETIFRLKFRLANRRKGLK